MSSKKYRSKLEAKIGSILTPDWEYEPVKVAYTIQKKYTPDFVYNNVHVEVKGWFRPGDTQKYKAIIAQMKSEGKEFVFVFQDPFKKTRKGGLTRLYQWAEKQKVRWYGADEESLWELINYADS